MPPELRERLGEVPVAMLEKAKQAGRISSPVRSSIRAALRRLSRDARARRDAFYGPVEHESVYFLTKQNALRTPPRRRLKDEGNYVASLSRLGRWLADRRRSRRDASCPRRRRRSS